MPLSDVRPPHDDIFRSENARQPRRSTREHLVRQLRIVIKNPARNFSRDFLLRSEVVVQNIIGGLLVYALGRDFQSDHLMETLRQAISVELLCIYEVLPHFFNKSN